MMITVFTPTYNRAYIIDKLYESLCSQTCPDFEWLIVDDGSTDDTEALIDSFIAERKINIRYVKQSNGGKHRAINRGVRLAKGELFFIVDSDDQLPCESIQFVLTYYLQIKNETSFAGVSGLKYLFSGERIGGEVSFSVVDCSFVEFRTVYKVKGDLAEVYRTDILRQYPFPEIEGENFCPEAIVWYQIAQKYKLRFFNEKIYLCDYLPDGLTNKITKLRMKNPVSSVLTYAEVYKAYKSFYKRMKFSINFWRFFFCMSRKQFNLLNKHMLIYPNVFYLPLGFLYHIVDLLKIK